MKKRVYIGGIMTLLLLLAPVFGYCQWGDALVQSMPNGSIDWSNGIIQAKGIGAPPQALYGKPQARPMAIRAAQLDAYRNLLELVQGVRVSSTTLVKNYVTENDVIMTRVDGLVKGAKTVKTEYMSDGTVEVTLQMSINGDFARVILPPAIGVPEQPPAAIPQQPVPGEGEAPVAAPAVYTGLVVDARGLDAKPAMAPRILDEDGKEVYGSAHVSREYAIQQGMSGYSKRIEAAVANERVADNPLVVKGLRTEGPGRCDIVISNADADKIRNASGNLSFLEKCRVMIVVD
ncbi:MAG: hypothetical protein B5M56_05710 [Desulfococcus sp. 4484_241]|nr:MAG: hypothetical protein B5M56_05710 [Desulfococcus sp. 4484_241]